MKLGILSLLCGVAVLVVTLAAPRVNAGPAEPATTGVTVPAATTLAKAATEDKLVKSDAEWKKLLKPDEYEVCRQKGTERAFTGKYWDNHEAGVYRCVACGRDLFTSDTKFESGTGWPSFFQPVAGKAVSVGADRSYGMERQEVTCTHCGAHLGHVFDDGPKPTGLRYCINSASLTFVSAKELAAQAAAAQKPAAAQATQEGGAKPAEQPATPAAPAK